MKIQNGVMALTREQLNNLYINAAQFYAGEDVSKEVLKMRVLDIHINLRKLIKLAQELGDWENAAVIGSALGSHLFTLVGAVRHNGKTYYYDIEREEWTVYELGKDNKITRVLDEETHKMNERAKWDAEFLKRWLDSVVVK